MWMIRRFVRNSFVVIVPHLYSTFFHIYIYVQKCFTIFFNTQQKNHTHTKDPKTWATNKLNLAYNR